MQKDRRQQSFPIGLQNPSNALLLQEPAHWLAELHLPLQHWLGWLHESPFSRLSAGHIGGGPESLAGGEASPAPAPPLVPWGGVFPPPAEDEEEDEDEDEDEEDVDVGVAFVESPVCSGFCESSRSTIFAQATIMKRSGAQEAS